MKKVCSILAAAAFLMCSDPLGAITDQEFRRTDFYRFKRDIDFRQKKIKDLEQQKRTDVYAANQKEMYKKQIVSIEAEARKLLQKKRARLDGEKKMLQIQIQNSASGRRYISPSARKRLEQSQKDAAVMENKLNEIEKLLFPAGSEIPAADGKDAPAPGKGVPAQKKGK